jgi:hypothetical protein
MAGKSNLELSLRLDHQFNEERGRGSLVFQAYKQGHAHAFLGGLLALDVRPCAS